MSDQYFYRAIDDSVRASDNEKLSAELTKQGYTSVPRGVWLDHYYRIKNALAAVEEEAEARELAHIQRYSTRQEQVDQAHYAKRDEILLSMGVNPEDCKYFGPPPEVKVALEGENCDETKLIRWNPGAYMSIRTPRTTQQTAQQQMQLPLLCDNNYWEGVHVRFMWQELEPTLGNYDWSYLDDIFAEAEVCGNKKRRVIVAVSPLSFNQFADPAFGPPLSAPMDADPAYMCTWERSGNRWKSLLDEWNTPNPLQDAFYDFWVAFAARYGDNELLEAVAMHGESAIGGGVETECPGFDMDLALSYRFNELTRIQELMPCVQIDFGMNYLGTTDRPTAEARIQDSIDWVDAAAGRGLTWPDTWGHRNRLMPITELQRFISANGGRWGTVGDSQNPSNNLRYRTWFELWDSAQSPSFTPNMCDGTRKVPPSTDPDCSWRVSHLVYLRTASNAADGMDDAALQAHIDTNPGNAYSAFPSRWAALGAAPLTGATN